MSNKKLLKAPLQEVILELNWEESIDEAGNQVDFSFELAQGKFAQNIKSHLPVHKKIINGQTVFGKPVHQYWADEFQWPVVQHGPGVLTINQTEEKYIWKDFQSLIDRTIQSLYLSYDNKITINRISLEYVDAFNLDKIEPINFTQNNLQTSISSKYEIPGSLNNFNLTRSYIQEDASLLTINITDAINNLTNEKAIILATSISKEADVLNELINDWLETSHDICSTIFKNILEPNFYGNLNK